MFVNKSSPALVGKPGTAKCGGSCRASPRRAGVRAGAGSSDRHGSTVCCAGVSVSGSIYDSASVCLSVCVLSDNRE